MWGKCHYNLTCSLFHGRRKKQTAILPSIVGDGEVISSADYNVYYYIKKRNNV